MRTHLPATTTIHDDYGYSVMRNFMRNKNTNYVIDTDRIIKLCGPDDYAFYSHRSIPPQPTKEEICTTQSL